MSKQTTFNPDWLNDPLFAPWLERVSQNPKVAKCKVCCKTFNLSNMGRRAVSSHMNGEKHKKLSVVTANSTSLRYFKNTENKSLPIASTSQNTTSPESEIIVKRIEETSIQNNPGSNKTGLESFLINDNVTKAEILWSIESVLTHTSLRTAGRDVSLFKIMFPDSVIANKMQLQRDKIGYLIAYGIAPFLKNELLKKINQSQFLVIGFDESLNKVAQKQQMDINVRFWDEEANEVTTRYLTSVFLGRSTANDILVAFKEGIQLLDKKNILQISMDGPNVNHKFLRELKEELKAEFDTKTILELGSCGLHTLHNAFKLGMKETGWEIVPFLRAVYNLFKDTPARRAMYTEITKSTVFPLKFCAVRWLENVKVAQRALDILKNIINFINEISKTKRISSTSFETICKMIKDPFLPVKLQFFVSFASDMEPFLKQFQSDKPLAPFLFDSLMGVVKTQMEKVLKSSVLETVSNLKNILDKENILNSKNINLGISTKSALRNMSTKPSELQILQFKDNCRKCFLKFIEKMLERSPIKHPLTRAISCFDPEVASNLPISKTRMEKLLTILLESGWILSSLADRALQEYKELCSSDVAVTAFRTYQRKERLDHFWIHLLNERKLHNLAQVMKIVTTLSHGNASVERGFSINKECLVENMKEDLLISRRFIYDHITSIGGIEKLVVSKGLVQSARNAYSKFKEAQKKKKTEEETVQLERQRKRAVEREKVELEAKKAKILQEAQRQANLLDEQIKKIDN